MTKVKRCKTHIVVKNNLVTQGKSSRERNEKMIDVKNKINDYNITFLDDGPLYGKTVDVMNIRKSCDGINLSMFITDGWLIFDARGKDLNSIKTEYDIINPHHVNDLIIRTVVEKILNDLPIKICH